MAKRGKISVEWFYGFKLHLVVNHKGEIMTVHITPGNCDDRAAVQSMVKELQEKLFGDGGYTSLNRTIQPNHWSIPNRQALRHG